MIGQVFAGVTVGGLLLIGAGALLAPRPSSAQYGIVLDDPRALALFRAMGVRDLALGLVLGLVWMAGSRDLLALAILATTPIAVVDLAMVTIDRRPDAAGVAPSHRARLLHAAGALGLLSTALLLRAGY